MLIFQGVPKTSLNPRMVEMLIHRSCIVCVASPPPISIVYRRQRTAVEFQHQRPGEWPIMASTNSHRVHAPTPAPIRKVPSTSTWDGRDGSMAPSMWRCECWMLVGGSFLSPKTQNKKFLVGFNNHLRFQPHGFAPPALNHLEQKNGP